MEYNPQIAYAFTACEGESPDPEKTCGIILDEIEKTELKKEDFDRIKKVVWGDYIRSFNDIEGYAHSFITELFTDGDYFDYPEVFDSVSFEDVKARFALAFARDKSALSVIKPTK